MERPKMRRRFRPTDPVPPFFRRIVFPNPHLVVGRPRRPARASSSRRSIQPNPSFFYFRTFYIRHAKLSKPSRHPNIKRNAVSIKSNYVKLQNDKTRKITESNLISKFFIALSTIETVRAIRNRNLDLALKTKKRKH